MLPMTDSHLLHYLLDRTRTLSPLHTTFTLFLLRSLVSPIGHLVSPSLSLASSASR